MIWTRNLILTGSANRSFGVDYCVPSSGKNWPVVIFSHGFKGFKDFGVFDLVAEAFAQAGYAFVKFNFSHNGTTVDDPMNFGDLEAFGHNNFNYELDDLGVVIDHICAQRDNTTQHMDLERIGLIGHSRGGGITVLKAAEDDRIGAIATWAAVAEFGRFWSEDVLSQWAADGVMYVPNGRTKQNMQMYYSSYEDFYEHLDRLSIPENAQRLDTPALIVHGTKDETVAVAAAHQLHQQLQQSELLLIPDGNHTFSWKHPWTANTMPLDCQTVVDASIDFFNKNL